MATVDCLYGLDTDLSAHLVQMCLQLINLQHFIKLQIQFCREFGSCQVIRIFTLDYVLNEECRILYLVKYFVLYTYSGESEFEIIN